MSQAISSHGIYLAILQYSSFSTRINYLIVGVNMLFELCIEAIYTNPLSSWKKTKKKQKNTGSIRNKAKPSNTFWNRAICCNNMSDRRERFKQVKYNLTYCGLMIPYQGWSDLDQHWLRQWFVAWWHQAITCIIVVLSSIGVLCHSLERNFTKKHQGYQPMET